MSRNCTTKNNHTSRRGLFASSIWHCDCQPRLPAEKFQVKNGGKNHGRWLYTCQNPQPKRCAFFLWADDARIREEGAVLSGKNTEPGREGEAKSVGREVGFGDLGLGTRGIKDAEVPRTPKKQMKIVGDGNGAGLATPVSRPRGGSTEEGRFERGGSETRSPEHPRRWAAIPPLLGAQPTKQAQSPHFIEEQEESFDWSSSADEGLAELAETLDNQESPRKAFKSALFESPSKRSHQEMLIGTSDCPVVSEADTATSTWPFSTTHNDVVMTSLTTTAPASGLLTPSTGGGIRRQLFPSVTKPGPDRISYDTSAYESPSHQVLAGTHDNPQPEGPSPLALEVLTLLSPLRPTLTPLTEQSLISFLNAHHRHTAGLRKGRDIARLAVQTKEKKIAELQARISALENEVEMERTVIGSLKRDIAASPRKPGGTGGGGEECGRGRGGHWRNSEV